MALLDRRIEERAAQNEEIAAGLVGAEGVRARTKEAANSGWVRLLVEFRALASHDPAVNRRYAEAHGRRVQQLADVLGRLHERAGLEPAVPLRSMAELMLASARAARSSGRRTRPRYGKRT